MNDNDIFFYYKCVQLMRRTPEKHKANQNYF